MERGAIITKLCLSPGVEADCFIIPHHGRAQGSSLRDCKTWNFQGDAYDFLFFIVKVGKFLRRIVRLSFFGLSPPHPYLFIHYLYMQKN